MQQSIKPSRFLRLYRHATHALRGCPGRALTRNPLMQPVLRRATPTPGHPYAGPPAGILNGMPVFKWECRAWFPLPGPQLRGTEGTLRVFWIVIETVPPASFSAGRKIGSVLILRC